MITGVHAVVFDPEAARVREFFRDVLELPNVDAGGGWLIFALPPAELGIHPTDGPRHHQLYLMCDDIEATMTGLRERGVDFKGSIVEAAFGRMATILMPGGGELALYEPRHSTAIETIET